MHVLVHGGAGSAPDAPSERSETLRAAARRGCDAHSAVDAVEVAIRHLEDAPAFNAGRGGAVQADGTIRTDAGIMRDDRAVGAACAMPGVRQAISVARTVMEETPHVLLAGDGAVGFAEEAGVATDVDLWTDRTRNRWRDADPPSSPDDRLAWVRERFGGTDTVGAVANDGETIAAGTSTGGRWFALPGRVGDVPQVGSGFYASPAGGASATGAGEDIARTTLARRAVGHLEGGATAQEAADAAIESFGDHTDSTAGVIVLDETGAGRAHNAETMQTATVRSGDAPE